MSAEEIIEFIREKIPITYDLEKENITYKNRNPYYKVYRYMMKNKETIEKALVWVKNNIYYSDEQNEFTEKANPEELLKILREGK